jgi:predicted porin
MTRTVIALAVLGAFASAATAQSSVTVYGLVDVGVGKPIGTKDKQVRDGHASRLGFRGVEDLGGGWSAIFGFEHRFTPDTGSDATVVGAGPVGSGISNVSAATATNKFWNGYSTVGLRGPFGSINLGRQYTPGFNIQNTLDPFGGVTIANLRDSGTRLGGIGKIRIDDSIRWDYTVAGFAIAASIAEASQAGALAGPDRPVSASVAYTAGPLWLGAAYEDPANANDKQWNLGGKYTFGPAQLIAGIAGGTTAANAKARGWIVATNWRLGPGDLKAGIAQTKIASTVTSRRIGVGYHYPLSKRTKIYADLAHENKAATNKTGYDLGISHSF